jgi:hypothetical protein
MKRLASILSVALLFVAFSPFALRASAQESTPAPTDKQATARASTLTGYPELKVNVTNSSFELSSQQIPAGNVLLTVTNSTQADTGVGVLGPPPGETMNQLLALAATPSASAFAFPQFLYHAVIPGGPGDVPPGKTVQALLMLSAGDWAVFGDGPQGPAFFSAAQSADSKTDPPTANVTVEMGEFFFKGLDQGVSSGSQLWEVKNTGEQPHMLVLAQVPEGTTMDQIVATAEQAETGTPQAGAISPADLTFVPDSVFLQSSGQTLWLPVNLSAGSYAALCFVTDPNTGKAHVTEGMVSIFTVS